MRPTYTAKTWRVWLGLAHQPLWPQAQEAEMASCFRYTLSGKREKALEVRCFPPHAMWRASHNRFCPLHVVCLLLGCFTLPACLATPALAALCLTTEVKPHTHCPCCDPAVHERSRRTSSPTKKERAVTEQTGRPKDQDSNHQQIRKFDEGWIGPNHI